MKRFEITVSRTCWDSSTFVVDAPTLTEAEDKAYQMAADHEYGTGNDPDYVIEGVKELGPTPPNLTALTVSITPTAEDVNSLRELIDEGKDRSGFLEHIVKLWDDKVESVDD